jgi:hypothetical protein
MESEDDDLELLGFYIYMDISKVRDSILYFTHWVPIHEKPHQPLLLQYQTGDTILRIQSSVDTVLNATRFVFQ